MCFEWNLNWGGGVGGGSHNEENIAFSIGMFFPQANFKNQFNDVLFSNAYYIY